MSVIPLAELDELDDVPAAGELVELVELELQATISVTAAIAATAVVVVARRKPARLRTVMEPPGGPECPGPRFAISGDAV
jgi:hypothetical protein